MYNLLQYSKNYRKTRGSLWNYYRDEPSNTLRDREAGYDENKVGKNVTEIVVRLKHLSNFWKSLDMSLINCEIELILSWSKNCVLVDMTVRAAGNDNDHKHLLQQLD